MVNNKTHNATLSRGGCHDRVSSPVMGFSTLIISAPKSPNNCVAYGPKWFTNRFYQILPASTLEQSNTRIPRSGSRGIEIYRSIKFIPARTPIIYFSRVATFSQLDSNGHRDNMFSLSTILLEKS